MRRELVVGTALLLVACGSAAPVAAVKASPSPSHALSASAVATPAGSPSALETPSASPSPAPSAEAVVLCRNDDLSWRNVVMLGRWPGPHLIYDVSDPIHPTLICSIQNTSAHFIAPDTFDYLSPASTTETDLVRHAIGAGLETITARLPVATTAASWTPDGGTMAFTVNLPGSAQYIEGATQVWIYAQGYSGLLFTYPIGIGDCPCRFGLPAPVLALSPDGEYLAAGWPVGKGSVPIAVYRLADGARALTADASVYQTLWDRTGHRLYLIGQDVKAWTPEGGLVAIASAPWSFDPGLSPDGVDVAYTAYTDQTLTQVRIYVYDLKTKAARMLTDAMRSQVLFVKDGWVWYLQEIACGPNDACPGTTRPGTTVFAMNLATSVEQQVTFASGDAPLDRAGDMGSFAFQPGEFWPNS